MNNELEFKEYLIDILNKHDKGWIDGDKENTGTKTADVINNNLKIAIEIKDDTTYKVFHPKPGRIVIQTINLPNKSEQWKGGARDANNKFRHYFDYKTILIIRTEMVALPAMV